MNKYIKGTGILLASAVMLASTSCKKFLDVNDNPNNLSESKATMQLTLPSAQHTVAYVVGNVLTEVGGFLSQYWTQAPSATQYFDYDRYNFDATDGDREWGQLFAGALKDLQFVENKAVELKDSNYAAIALLMKSYTYQVITDVWGDVPYSQALQADKGILNPKYDNQSAIYEGIIKDIDKALVYLTNTSAKTPGVDDVVFQGDMMMWYKFANSLKLKVLMRQSKTSTGGSAAAFASLNGLTPADFLGYGEKAQITYIDKFNNKNPLYASIAGLGNDNNVASGTIADTLNTYGDPRAGYFFELNASGLVVGIDQGLAAASSPALPTTTPNAAVGPKIISATTPVIFMSGTEVLFLLAEAHERALLSGTAEDTYKEAVVSSMHDCDDIDTTGLGLFDAAPYAWDADPAMHLQQIGVQRWIALCGTQNIESWTEQRRTNYPALQPSLASKLPAGQMPARLVYPNQEATSNSNFPGQKPINERLWWDIN
jgi:Starch-binding associating with outer membrane